MHDSSRIHWLLGWMSLLLISGFLIINLLSYTEFLHILDRSIPLGQLPQQGAALHQELRQVFFGQLGADAWDDRFGLVDFWPNADP